MLMSLQYYPSLLFTFISCCQEVVPNWQHFPVLFSSAVRDFLRHHDSKITIGQILEQIYRIR